MLKFIKGITATVLSFLFILTIPTYASINTKINADEVLLNTGAPKELVEKLSDLQKEDIASFIIKGNAIYSGSETSRYYIDEESQELKLINPLMRGEISKADLQLSTDVWTSTTGTTAGNSYVTGTYEWLTKKLQIQDHLFTISMPSGWNVDSSTVKKVTWKKQDYLYQWEIIDNVNGRSFSNSDNSVTWSSLSDKVLNSPLMFFRGSCTFVARKTSSTASNQVKLQYGYATGIGSIGVTYGGFGVTYTGTSGLSQASETFNF